MYQEDNEDSESGKLDLLNRTDNETEPTAVEEADQNNTLSAAG